MLVFLSKTVPQWVSDSFPIIRIVMLVLMVILSVAMVVVVMSQPSASEGMSAMGGSPQQDSFFGKNKSKTFEGTLKKVTVGIAISLVVLCILFYVSLLIYGAGAAI